MDSTHLEKLMHELRWAFDDLKIDEPNRQHHRDVILNLLSEINDALLEAVPHTVVSDG